jgi:2-phospho-L-lactate guanylyltransferase
VQATVYRYDPDSGSGSVVTDEGAVLPFEVAALRLSGLRHLRPGQRLTVQKADDGTITALTLGTIGSTLRDSRGSRASDS